MILGWSKTKKGNPIPAESNCPDGRLKDHHTPPRYFRDNRQSCDVLYIINQNDAFVKSNYTNYGKVLETFLPFHKENVSAFTRNTSVYRTFPPLTVSRNLQPSISAAPRHISIRPRKMSKYSYMVQILSSTCRFREIFFASGSTSSREPVTA